MAIPKDMSDQTVAPQEDFVQTAGIISKATGGLRGAILDPLTKPGQRLDPSATAVDAAPVPDVTEMPLGPRVDQVPGIGSPATPPAAEIQPPLPVSPEEMEARVAARTAEIGTPREVPSPSKAQKDAGLVKGPVNTTFYDDDEFAATIQSAAKAAESGAVFVTKPSSMADVKTRAIELGIPQDNLDAIFSGQGITSGVGLDQLVEQMSGLVVLHDVSAQRLDPLMAAAQRGELDVAGEMELREVIAQHDMILAALSGAKTDIARSMNVFKGINAQGDAASLNAVRAHLQDLGGSDQLRVLAQAYNETNSQASRNKLIRNSARKKSYESMVYMAQSVMLNDPVTHGYNIAGNALNLFLDLPERSLAVPVGMLRQNLARVMGKQYNPDRYGIDDVMARASGINNGLLDGFSMFGRKLIDGGAVKDAARNPLRTDYWAGAEYKIPMVKGVKQVPDLSDSVLGKSLNAMGVAYSVPFRALGAADEFFGGVAQRMELHEQAYRLGGSTYDSVFKQLMEAGADERTANAQAIAAAQKQVQSLISERPDDISASMEGFRKFVTLQEDMNTDVPFSGIFAGIEKKLNTPLLKPLAPFSKTLTNIANIAAGRSPAAYFTPAFQSEVAKGGRHKDLAVSRALLGTMVGMTAYQLAASDAITGAGPKDTGLRQQLMARGWRPFSAKIPKELFGPTKVRAKHSEAVQRLIDVVGKENIIPGTGEGFEDYYFVSMKRLEPAMIPIMIGSAIHDAMKYDEYDPDGTLAEDLIGGAAAGLAEYSTALPALQTFGELVAIAGHRQTDSGDKMAASVSAVAKRYASFYVSGTPIVGISNSTLVARLERIVDPTVRGTGADPDTPAGFRGFEEALKRWRSRIPVYSEGLVPMRDVWGDEIGTTEAPAYFPLSTGVGKEDDLKELFNVIQYTMPQLPRYFQGIRVPDDVKYRFAELYAKEVTIDGLNMVQMLETEINEHLSDYAPGDPDYSIKQTRDLATSIINGYKDIAKLRMFGAIQEDPLDDSRVEYSLVGDDLSDYGFLDTTVEFPNFAEKLATATNRKLHPRLVAPSKPTLQDVLK